MIDAFSTLSRELSTDERKRLLARILSVYAQEEPEQEKPEEPEEKPPLDLNEEFSHLSFMRKILLALKSFFTQRPVSELTEDLLISRIRRKIQASCPGLIDFGNARFTKKLGEELAPLSNALLFMRAVLDGFPRERSFIAFLAGFELAPLNDRILSETDPQGIYQEPHLADDRAIRSEMGERFARLIDEITPKERTAVYRDVQRLQAFEALASFRIEELMKLFGPSSGRSTIRTGTKEDASDSGEADTRGPSLQEMGSRLLTLTDSTDVAFHPPSPLGWSALFLFKSGEALTSAEFDLEKETSAFLARIRSARKAIVSFLSRVPLADIMRYILRDVSFTPKPVKGGEEWFVLFRSFWEDRLDNAIRAFSVQRKKEASVSEALDFLGIPELPYLSNYRSSFGGGAEHQTSLALLRAFHEGVYIPKIDRLLKIVNINGDFYKEENRDAFTDCCKKILEWQKGIELLEERLSKGGDFGIRLAALHAGQRDQDLRGRIRSLHEEVNAEARRITDTLYSTLNQLSRILFGILFGEAGSPYDSLMNLKTIGGRENKAIIGGLENAISSIDRFTSILAQVRDVEVS